MSVVRQLSETLGIDRPLLLAPMGSVSGGALAAAVSAAGGLGLIGAGYGDAEWMRAQFAAAHGARVGIGFITWSLAKKPELLELALAQRPAAIMLSFGDPQPFAAKIRASGARLICQVQSLRDAHQALAAGADVLVAQGTEAGGHGGSRALFALLPAVRDLAREVPVLGAGGIADRRGFEAALALGAAGVLVGTRFFASDEALAPHTAKQRIVAADGDATLRTSVFDIVRGYDWPRRFTGRALKNAFARTWHGNEDRLHADLAAEQTRYRDAAAKADYDIAVIFAGEAVDLIDEVLPAATIVERICR